MNSDEAITRAGFEAFNARDRARLESLWSDSTVLKPSTTGGDAVAGGEFVGQAGLDRYFAELAADWDDLRSSPLAIEALAPGRVLVANRLSGRGRASGAPVAMDSWIAIRLRDGRFQSITTCTTLAGALEVLDVASPSIRRERRSLKSTLSAAR